MPGALFPVVDYISGVPPVLIDLERAIMHDRAHLIELCRFIMMRGLIKMAVRYPQREKQN